ncbi:hypothetical protein SPBR_00743 [Sporothrix brasiliensis 5110]|uniref:Dihydrodipicolinate synthetase family protein n=1 Tax=Sporothrix brasiliensis 5110 TaxID=1398154 RepID=A0A0C2IVX5_9PEZI|nr:uncharacterized protein SPBR_00743 [Sporothrix brasiliensis 5110]KIH90945.1 hypothetical protein SPBR_00743 [Sporothrix brasiliensis 5110]
MSSLSINVDPVGRSAGNSSETPPKTPRTPATVTGATASGTQAQTSAAADRSRHLPDGVYVPMLTFFEPETEDLDLASMQKQAARLQQAGVAGILLHGSNGEAAHLTHEERIRNIQAVVDAVRADRFEDSATPFPILAGCGAQSVRETVDLCVEAASAGATHALVLPPGYYASILGRDQLREFFLSVASQSPIPVLVYNFPAAASGIDLDSDTICALAGAHPNIVGVKLTCGNTGKLARVVAGVSALGRGPGSGNPFFVAGGSADFILQGAVVGANGSISGLANLSPRACTSILDLFHAGRIEEARALQAIVAQGDWLAIRYGFVGVKHGLQSFGSIGGAPASSLPSPVPRKPCQLLSAAAQAEFDAGTEALLKAEQALVMKAQS